MNKKIVSLVLAGLITTSTCILGYANESKNVGGVKSATIQEKEPNDTTAEAQKISFDTKVVGFKDKYDLDYFEIKLSNKAIIDMNFILRPVGSVNEGGITIYNSDIKEVYYKDLDKGITKDKISLNKGTYYISLGEHDFGLYRHQTWNYEFNLSVNYFSDAKDHWAEKQINNFVDLGYIDGYLDGTFKPNNSITRAEFVKLLNKKFGLTKFSGKLFSDTQNHWARKDIDIAVTNGVCKGKSSTEFKPNDPITREEAALMIANYKKIKDNNHNKINIFYDNNSVSSWAKDGVEGVLEKGYMVGYEDNTFNPKGQITRAEAVVTLSRVK